MPVFVDTNVPIYAVGRPHLLRAPCIEALRLVDLYPQAFFTDAEVLQELIHVYLGRRRWSDGRAVFNRFAVLMRGRIEPMRAGDVQAAAALADQYTGLSARDLIHFAIMVRVGATRIVSTDRGFDSVPAIQRLDPADVEGWRGLITPP